MTDSAGAAPVGARAPIEPLIQDIVDEMTEALSVGEFFNPSLRFANGDGAVLDWRDRLSAFLRAGPAQKDAPEPEKEKRKS